MISELAAASRTRSPLSSAMSSRAERSSVAIALTPAAVSFSAKDRLACSSCLHTGAPGFALISFARPPSMSFAATFCAAPPLRFRGAARQRSSRRAPALRMAICVSVSLMDMNVTLRVASEPGQSRRLTDTSPGSMTIGAEGCPPVNLNPADMHTHARFRTKRQSFLRFPAGCVNAYLALTQR